MPPLGPETHAPEFTESEIESHRLAWLVYQTAASIIANRKRRESVMDRPPLSYDSAKAFYPHPELEERQQMSVWLKVPRDASEVSLLTQVAQIYPDGEYRLVGTPQTRFVVRGPNTVGEYGRSFNAMTQDEQLQRIEDTRDTVNLIRKAEGIAQTAEG